MSLTLLDWLAIAAYFAVNVGIGLYYRRRATSSNDATDRIIYNKNTGALLYDYDGTGAGTAVQFATVSTGLNMTHADFFVV